MVVYLVTYAIICLNCSTVTTRITESSTFPKLSSFVSCEKCNRSQISTIVKIDECSEKDKKTIYINSNFYKNNK